MDPLNDDEEKYARIRRQRNVVLALLLGGFVVLVYLISIAKMG